MNYLLFYNGKIPDYYKFTVNSILSVDAEANIFFCGSSILNHKEIDFSHTEDIVSTLTNEIIDLNIYKDTSYEFKENRLWSDSLLRVFYINDLAKNMNIEEFVHFDLDVIIYKSFSDLKHLFNPEKINITEHIDNTPIFGYSYIPSSSLYSSLCSLIYKYIKDEYLERLKNKNIKPLNEMEMLSVIKKQNTSIFSSLPILPYFKNKILFDPATYGQYFDGIPAKPYKKFRRRHISMEHIAGKEISSGRVEPIYRDRPLIKYNDNNYEIANLHIHSKRLNKYLPENYKQIIK